MTILDALRSISAYPIPLRTLSETAEYRGVVLEAEPTAEVMTAKAYRLATADLLLWLAFAPNISQGGQSYSFDAAQRLEFRRRANATYKVLEPDKEDAAVCATFGYKGDRL